MSLPEDPSTIMLTSGQAYEAAYRFVAQYYGRQRIVPFLLMLVAMEPKGDLYRTNDPASWDDWMRCGGGQPLLVHVGDHDGGAPAGHL